MGTAAALIVIVVLLLAGAFWWYHHSTTVRQREFDDAKAEARRWVERLGGQVLNLVGSTEPAKQALADAAERHNAAGSQLEQANTPEQCRLTTRTALEGLYYVRAARTAMDMDPGPELPDLDGQREAGTVTEYREVEVNGGKQMASPEPGEHTPHYYPGGRVAGRPVPRGWYSEPWWKPALAAGAWGMGSFLLMGALFSGMSGVPAEAAAGQDPGGDAGGGADDPGADGGGEFDGGFDMDGFDLGGF
ncbi:MULTISPECIES: hypothetical protein [unclassified Actinopolyspora]|uniref:hypothetical protein n=1 Tax=unclassified Actinopolyspora TaxID=2639451 RepID=UPI0013F65165|nr:MULTISPECIES: hypothetical protein [unclassified Actinopolyspora]NHD18429.1 hypothetical protein [Actinopolyspora sp. BKK2]NHE77612.1 hypothetical protein [Actinopolyspora sp. BKK1]